MFACITQPYGLHGNNIRKNIVLKVKMKGFKLGC